MADENTQVAPVAGAETNATQEQPTKLYVYYYSNPDGATKDERCHEIFTEIPFDVVPWRMHKEAPDASMSDPVWDDKLNGGLGAWKENSGEAQGQILAEAQAKIEELDKEKESFREVIKTVQETQNTSTTQSLAMTKMLKNVTENQETTNKVLASMQKILVAIQQPAADKNENGGN